MYGKQNSPPDNCEKNLKIYSQVFLNWCAFICTDLASVIVVWLKFEVFDKHSI